MFAYRLSNYQINDKFLRSHCCSHTHLGRSAGLSQSELYCISCSLNIKATQKSYHSKSDVLSAQKIPLPINIATCLRPSTSKKLIRETAFVLNIMVVALKIVKFRLKEDVQDKKRSCWPCFWSFWWLRSFLSFCMLGKLPGRTPKRITKCCL